MTPWFLFDLLLIFIFACAVGLCWLAGEEEREEELWHRTRRDYGRLDHD